MSGQPELRDDELKVVDREARRVAIFEPHEKIVDDWLPLLGLGGHDADGRLEELFGIGHFRLRLRHICQIAEELADRVLVEPKHLGGLAPVIVEELPAVSHELRPVRLEDDLVANLHFQALLTHVQLNFLNGLHVSLLCTYCTTIPKKAVGEKVHFGAKKWVKKPIICNFFKKLIKDMLR